MSTDWSMPRRGEACDGCQRRFEPGDTLRAHLYAAAAGYQRHDYCDNCQPPADSAPLAVWTTRRPESAARQARTLDWASIYHLFERLEEPAESRQVQLRFLLGLLLWRKKVLRLEDSGVANDHEVWEYVEPRTGRQHRVERPELDESQMEQLSAQLEQVLSGSAGEPEALGVEWREESDDA